MKKISLLALFFSLLVGGLSAQLINDGGTITIQSGAKLIVESDISNSNSGSIINNGTIEVEGDFTNNAMITSGMGSSLVFKGDANSDFKPGATTDYAIVKTEKTAGNINLVTDNLSVLETVDFTGVSNIVLGAQNVMLDDAATVINADQATGWFVTDGAGLVSKQVDAAGSFTFDLGDATNYSKLVAAHTGTYTAGTSRLEAKVTPSAHPNLPGTATDYIARYWDVNHNTITAPSTMLTGTYVAGDVTGTAASIKGARYEAGAWEYATGATAGMTVSATTTSVMSGFTGSNFFGKTDLTVFLQGPYNSATGLMKTDLRNFDNGTSIVNLIPLTSPYDGTTTAVSVPANAVDWIELIANDGGTEYKASGFLLEDGTMVDVDGVSNLAVKDAPLSSTIEVNHRNHLTIRTANAYNLETGSALDMSVAGNVYTDAGISNAAQKDLGAGKMAMWAGDTTGDDNVFYVGGLSDRTPILLKVGFTTLSNVVDGYELTDVTMDGKTAYVGGLSDGTPILLNVGFTTLSNNLEAHK